MPNKTDKQLPALWWAVLGAILTLAICLKFYELCLTTCSSCSQNVMAEQYCSHCGEPLTSTAAEKEG